jgi:hypothetical protein
MSISEAVDVTAVAPVTTLITQEAIFSELM